MVVLYLNAAQAHRSLIQSVSVLVVGSALLVVDCWWWCCGCCVVVVGGGGALSVVVVGARVLVVVVVVGIVSFCGCALVFVVVVCCFIALWLRSCALWGGRIQRPTPTCTDHLPWGFEHANVLGITGSRLWALVLCPWAFALCHCALVLDLCASVFDVWSLVHGLRPLVHGPRALVFGSWSAVLLFELPSRLGLSMALPGHLGYATELKHCNAHRSC